jgi:hypothetical protein
MTYSEKLKDPRWQKRRLDVLEKAEWQCAVCQSESKEMHVHHNVYKKGHLPWEYDDLELRALCKDCHKDEEEIREEFLSLICRVPPEYPLLTILEAVRQIFSRGDEWEFNDWCFCAEHPDLMREAHRRRVERVNRSNEGASI